MMLLKLFFFLKKRYILCYRFELCTAIGVLCSGELEGLGGRADLDCVAFNGINAAASSQSEHGVFPLPSAGLNLHVVRWTLPSVAGLTEVGVHHRLLVGGNTYRIHGGIGHHSLFAAVEGLFGHSPFHRGDGPGSGPQLRVSSN